MKDRNVEYPNRFRLTKVAGTSDVYDVVPAPGDVYEEGTLIGKAALLKDTTAALYGLDSTAVPDDVLKYLSNAIFNVDGVPKDINGTVVGTQTEFGSYTGTGTYGYSNQSKLTFSFSPKFVYLFTNMYGTGYIFVRGATISYQNQSGGGYTTVECSMSEKILSWYSISNAIAQANVSGTTYYYFAIG